MKILIMSICFITSVYGANLSVIGPCDKTPVYSEELSVELGDNVGTFSIRFFDQFNIDYVGSERGMNSILNTPTGLDAMEVVSDNEMMAYGWCYSINGTSPEVYPDEVEIKEEDQVIWWFGYAHYLDGQWVTQCSPSYERRSDFICD